MIDKIISSPSRAFLLIALVYGTLILVVTPPFQANDELNHFYRAVQILDGKCLSQKSGDNVGGVVDKRLLFNDTVFADMPFNMFLHIRPSHITEFFTKDINAGHRYISEQEKIAKTSKPKFQVVPNETVWYPVPSDKTKIFVDFPNTALYTCIGYVPSMAGLLLGKSLKVYPILLLYFGRAFSLLAWIFLIYCAIVICPVKKWLIFFLALMPTMIFEGSMLNAGNLLIACSFLFIALILRYCFDESARPGLMGTLLLLCLATVIIMIKPAGYMPLLFCLLLIPAKKLNGRTGYWFLQALAWTICIAAVLFWVWIINKNGLYKHLRGADPYGQLKFIFHNPVNAWKINSWTIRRFYDFYLETFVARLGWIDVWFNKYFIYAYTSILLVISMVNTDKEKYDMSILQRLIIAGIAVVSFYHIHLMFYLSWSYVGDPMVEGVVGRYFLPFSLLIFLPFYNIKVDLSRYEKQFGRALFLLSNAAMMWTLCALVDRYYGWYWLTVMLKPCAKLFVPG